MFERLLSALKNLKWASRSVQKVILSHAHPDHVGAMEILLAESSPESIILHEIDIPYAPDPEKLLERDNVINNALQTGPKTFEELNRLLFDKSNIQFFPGTPILESHLQKLIKERKIRNEGTGSDRFCIS